MGKYCCFFCPSKDYSEKILNDKCPKCQRNYGFVLEKPPLKIGDYRIIDSLGRGFYGATYVAEGKFKKKKVIKVTPVNFYEFFNKPSFEEETTLHADVTNKAEYIIGIEDAFTETIEFSDDNHTQLNCYVSVLEYVDGPLLREYLEGNVSASAETICQIAIDLIKIRSEFEAYQVNHNDLHAENLIVEHLPTNLKRDDAIDGTIRVRAIDLGSISDGSKSSPNRYGDLTFIADHVDSLVKRLLDKPDDIDDREFRIALALQTIISGLRPNAQNLRRPSSSDLVELIREAYYRSWQVWRPWANPLMLKAFGDHYNAQTLESWNVPQLLVDPGNEWVDAVKKSGPQIITGMRGCGKTMLLRALDIHARAARLNDESEDEIVKRIKDDGFVGLFVSAQRLLDLREQSLLKIEHRLSRLYASYALEAVRALLHIKDVKNNVIHPMAHRILGGAIADYLGGAEDLREITSLEDLERQLQRIVVYVTRGEESYSVSDAPALIFPHLAEKFKVCSSIFESSMIFFLLDDVSTRYLEMDKIEKILSANLFQSPHCAFKFTSEWQTVELGLMSPGGNHPIRVGRDVDVFDLGENVFQTIKDRGNKGKEFVVKILKQRAKFHSSTFRGMDPKKILGDVSLEKIAEEIAASSKTSSKRKNVYRGLSCLTNVCVGDIGDVIKLYEEILQRAPNDTMPISQGVQSDCFQVLSSLRLFDLNRRDGYFKSHALAFAEAAHTLLVRSYTQGKKVNNEKPRLRQYTSLYVRVTTEDENSLKQQIDVLRELIDAGVFVYAGGAPRSKTKDSNPTRYFKLSYRKIYGLASFIGLADRDRFELSGDDLQEWLDTPAKAKDILIRNQINDPDEELNDNSSESEFASKTDEIEESSGDAQQIIVSELSLFDSNKQQNDQVINYVQAPGLNVTINRLSIDALSDIEIGGVLGGLGFEDRTKESNQKLARIVKPNEIHLIKYSHEGYSAQINQSWAETGITKIEHPHNTVLYDLPKIKGTALIDVSGLTKPVIFKSIRRELYEKGRVLVCHASAEKYYPLPEDIERVFAAEEANEPSRLLESIANILKGESGGYKSMQLLKEETDLSRNRALIAFASAKHERLFSLLDHRDFDFIKVITPAGSESWKNVAQLAANVLCKSYQNAELASVDIKDLAELVKYLDDQYLQIYNNAGANLEIGLTGSKMQAVATAVLSSKRKLSEVWYLGPNQFDEKRFSYGVGEIKVYDIRID
ncbi:hypothetical protein SPFL3102_00237 [Sporomusaceae bacterium FL31]|nr:hypothetical protein SPFL3101_01729 [Sporomusaceae bacterium FL31]GCE32459.1 hypothetical protein SPFL3102_00237 [Sporomusaceae bacterium]